MFFSTGIALAPLADRWESGPYDSDRVRCPGSGRLYFVITEGAGGTGTVTITANAFAAATGGSGTPLAFRYKVAQTPGEVDNSGSWTVAPVEGVGPAAGANKKTLIEFRFDDLPAALPFVMLTFTELVDAACDASCDWFILEGDRGFGNSNLS
jgi:hypothetical protein